MTPYEWASILQRAFAGQVAGNPNFPGYVRLRDYLSMTSQDGDAAFAPGVNLLVDVEMQDSDRLGQITNAGTIMFDPTVNTRLIAAGIDNVGSTAQIRIGTAVTPHPTRAVIDLCGRAPTINGYTPSERTALGIGSGVIRGLTHIGNTPTGNDGVKNDSGGYSRGLINRMGASIKVYGAGPAIRRLNAHYASGTTLVLDTPITAKAGDSVLVSPTGFFDATRRTEVRTLAADVTNSTTITITQALGFARWGVLQYATDRGISLTADAFTDCSSSRYTASISGTTMTVTAVATAGPISVGQRVYKADGIQISPVGDTYVDAFIGGTGGVGTYTVSRSQSVGSQTLIVQGMRADAAQIPIIDQRAYVCVMSSNVRFRGYDAGNTSLASLGFGFHGMTMGLTSETVLSGVEFDDFGQDGLLGRYGWHVHRPSYKDDGTINTDGIAGSTAFSKTAGAAGPNYPAGKAVITGCSFYRGHNRANVLHACRGVAVTGNISYKSAGHSFFEEDGSEEDNAVQSNVAISPEIPSNPLKQHDTSAPAGFWFANLNNDHYNNMGVDCAGIGFWNALSYGLGGPNTTTNNGYNSGCLGASAGAPGANSGVPIWPFFAPVGRWKDNGAFSCAQGGESGRTPGDNQGNENDWGLPRSRADGQPATDPQTPVLIEGMRLMKCGIGDGTINFGADRPSYHNRAQSVEYRGLVTADNRGPHLQGQVVYDNSVCKFPIAVGESLNHENHTIASGVTFFAASYHGALKMDRLSVYNFSGGPELFVANNRLERTCVLQSWDNYLDPIHAYSQYFPGWRMHQSSGVWLTPTGSLINDVTLYNDITNGRNFQNGQWCEDYPAPINGIRQPGIHARNALGILYDKFGSFSKGPNKAGVPDSHLVQDVPFHTLGAPAGVTLEENHRVKAIQGSFIGISPCQDDISTVVGSFAEDSSQPMIFWRPLTYQRVDESRNPIAGATLGYRPDYPGNQGPDNAITVSYRMAAVPKGSIVRQKPQVLGSTLGGPCVDAAPNRRYFLAVVSWATPELSPYCTNFDDYVIYNVPWAGDVPPRVVLTLNDGGDVRNGGGEALPGGYSDGRAYIYASINSWAGLLAANSGFYWWHDTAANQLWIKLRVFSRSALLSVKPSTTALP